MGNVNKPFPVELLENTIWRAIIKIAIGVDVETAALEVVDIWDSAEMQESLAKDDRASKWFKNLRGKLIIYSIYVYPLNSIGIDTTISSSSIETVQPSQASNAEQRDASSDYDDEHIDAAAEKSPTDMLANIRDPSVSDERAQKMFLDFIARLKQEPQPSVPLLPTLDTTDIVSDHPTPSPTHDEQDVRLSRSPRLISRLPSPDYTRCELCGEAPYHPLEACPLVLQGKDALASEILKLQIHNGSERLIHRLREIWTHMWNSGKSIIRYIPFNMLTYTTEPSTEATISQSQYSDVFGHDFGSTNTQPNAENDNGLEGLTIDNLIQDDGFLDNGEYDDQDMELFGGGGGYGGGWDREHGEGEDEHDVGISGGEWGGGNWDGIGNEDDEDTTERIDSKVNEDLRNEQDAELNSGEPYFIRQPNLSINKPHRQ